MSYEFVAKKSLIKWISDIVDKCFDTNVRLYLSFTDRQIHNFGYSMTFNYTPTPSEICGNIKTMDELHTPINIFLDKMFRLLPQSIAHYFEMFRDENNKLPKDRKASEKRVEEIKQFLTPLVMRYDDVECCFIMEAINKTEMLKITATEQIKKLKQIDLRRTYLHGCYQICMQVFGKEDYTVKEAETLLPYITQLRRSDDKENIVYENLRKIINGKTKNMNMDFKSYENKIIYELEKVKNELKLDEPDEEYEKFLDVETKKLEKATDDEIAKDEINTNISKFLLTTCDNTRLYLSLTRAEYKNTGLVDKLIKGLNK